MTDNIEISGDTHNLEHDENFVLNNNNNEINCQPEEDLLYNLNWSRDKSSGLKPGYLFRKSMQARQNVSIPAVPTHGSVRVDSPDLHNYRYPSPTFETASSSPTTMYPAPLQNIYRSHYYNYGGGIEPDSNLPGHSRIPLPAVSLTERSSSRASMDEAYDENVSPPPRPQPQPEFPADLPSTSTTTDPLR